VVHLDRWLASEDGAEASLLINEGGHLCGTDAISVSQAVMAMTAVQALNGFFVPVVVTGPAIGGTPVPRVLVATEGVERLYLAAVKAPLPGWMGTFGSPRLPLHRTSVRMATDKNWPILSPDEEGLGGD
jgi:hypothetical protein